VCSTSPGYGLTVASARSSTLVRDKWRVNLNFIPTSSSSMRGTKLGSSSRLITKCPSFVTESMLHPIRLPLCREEEVVEGDVRSVCTRKHLMAEAALDEFPFHEQPPSIAIILPQNLVQASYSSGQEFHEGLVNRCTSLHSDQLTVPSAPAP
jgi:hypothetical protein